METAARQWKRALLIIAALVFLCFSACGKPPEDPEEGLVARVGEIRLSKSEFEALFRLSLASNLSREAHKEAKLRFFEEQLEQLLVLERARQTGTTLADRELDRVLEEILKDYPPGEFEAQLLARDINWMNWKEALRRRLLVKKTIEGDLAGKGGHAPGNYEAYIRALRETTPMILYKERIQ